MIAAKARERLFNTIPCGMFCIIGCQLGYQVGFISIVYEFIELAVRCNTCERDDGDDAEQAHQKKSEN